jgi:hypothetical protein
LGGKSESKQLHMACLDYASLLSDVVTALAAASAVVIAYRGLQTWREQHTGRERYEAARTLRLTARELYEAIQTFRLAHAGVFGVSDATKAKWREQADIRTMLADSQGKSAPTMLFPGISQEALLANLNNLAPSVTKFLSALFESEFLIGSSAVEGANPFLGAALEYHSILVKLASLDPERAARNYANQTETSEHERAVLFGAQPSTPDKDEFGTRLMAGRKALDEALRKYIVLE